MDPRIRDAGVFHTFTGDKRYREYKAFLIERSRKGEVKMCTLLDEFEKEGLEKGLKTRD